MDRLVFAWLVVALTITSSRANEFEPAHTHAVLIGVLEWKHGLSDFPKANRKDVELRDVLLRRGVPAENITLLLDRDATLKNIRAAISNSISKADGDSTLIIYYAGHGWPAGEGDYCLANYDVHKDNRATAWSLNELGTTLANDFHGQQVFLWADCCYSGGLEVVVDALAKRRIAAFSLTSAGTANTSTSNWTFTQSIIDGLRGEPIVDANADGQITLIELRSEVGEAMRHLEGQACGFAAHSMNDGFILSKAAGPRPQGSNPTLPIGSYVEASGGRNRYFGRVVAADKEHATVQFYDYTEKRAVKFTASDITPSKRAVRSMARLDAGIKPDCMTEWRGTWFPAKVLKRKMADAKPQYFIHYLGYDDSWDEWVGDERIRLHLLPQ